MNKNAVLQSFVFALGGCFLITWVNEANALKSYTDLTSFPFVTKVVTNIVVLTGLNTYFASKNFRDSSSRTRESDSLLEPGQKSIRDLLNDRRK